MPPNAGFHEEFNAVWYVGKPDLNIQIVTHCDICEAPIPAGGLSDHLERCAEGSSVAYNLKTSVLHQVKLENLTNEIHSVFQSLMKGTAIKLPRGVCYCCKNADDHKSGLCKSKTRVEYMNHVLYKTSEALEWHFYNSQSFLIKGQLGIIDVKQRREKKTLYDEFEKETPYSQEVQTDGGNYPPSLAQLIQTMEKNHKEYNAEIREHLKLINKRFFEEQKEKRDSRNQKSLEDLAKKDSESPIEEIKFC
ncbi:hypothetical protein CAEBREN_18742 [Caenorhabditis brenneri]|uniref:Uncharacterized protein n=1 Tax=Caenorhabditis brenneri TaxID=135651 RepID=G0MAG8_CAEBE|nr:hypothetical protein CAEBREN_18742 [Caenorhabditis brenneri]